MAKNKHARRERFEANEKACGELLGKLEAWERTLTMGTAFNVAVVEMLKAMPEKLGMGGKINGEPLGKWMANEIDRQFKAAITPPKVETGEMEYE